MCGFEQICQCKPLSRLRVHCLSNLPIVRFGNIKCTSVILGSFESRQFRGRLASVRRRWRGRNEDPDVDRPDRGCAWRRRRFSDREQRLRSLVVLSKFRHSAPRKARISQSRRKARAQASNKLAARAYCWLNALRSDLEQALFLITRSAVTRSPRTAT